MTEPMNGLMPPNEADKFDEHVAVVIRTAVKDWYVQNNPADEHGVSMPEYIRHALADAGLLAPHHLTHSLCLRWDETCEGFTIISDGAEAGHIVALNDAVRQVMQERDEFRRAAEAEAQGRQAEREMIATAMHLKPTTGVDSIVHWAENYVDIVRNLVLDRDKVREELLPLLRQHPLSKDDVEGDDLRAGFIAKVAADVLRWYGYEMQRSEATSGKDALATVTAIVEERDRLRAGNAEYAKVFATWQELWNEKEEWEKAAKEAWQREKVLLWLHAEARWMLRGMARRVGDWRRTSAGHYASFYEANQERDEALAALEKQQALLAHAPSAGACSCRPALLLVHEPGSYCGDAQFEQMRERVLRAMQGDNFVSVADAKRIDDVELEAAGSIVAEVQSWATSAEISSATEVQR